jgi:hypothetical protein
MECSKCRLVKDKSNFYATGKVCKKCKQNYARTYRNSKTPSCATTDDAYMYRNSEFKAGDTQSCATTNDAYAEFSIMEHLRKIEADIEESNEKVYNKIAFLWADMHEATNVIMERLLKINESLVGRRYENSVRLTSHPLADFA